MVTKQGLYNSLTNPDYASGAISRRGMNANQFIHRNILKKFHNGIDVMEGSWDNLIILDGCRDDTFKEVNWIEGNNRSVTSSASESHSFLTENFIGKTLHDTVYVSGNPYLYDIPEGTFHSVYSAVESEWDADLETVPPEHLAEMAIDAYDQHPDKRLIVHLMQPHAPFIGEQGRRVEQGGWNPNGDSDSFIWTDLQYGRNGVERQEIKQLYQENLAYALEHVERLIDTIDGKTVLTSDHGNLIGDIGFPIPVRGYGHPPHYYHPALVTVPWHVIPGDRRQTQSDPPEKSQERIDEGVLEDRLSDLGYR